MLTRKRRVGETTAANLRSLWLILVIAGGGLLALSAPCRAQTAQISNSQASAHVGEQVVVDRTVASVHTSKKGHTFINFGAPYPRQDFTAVVFASSASAFRDVALSTLTGRHVRVTGIVRLYEGKPEIILDSRAQLNVLGK